MAVWIPDEGSEALRALVRAREAAKQDQMRARHRLSKFLLRSSRCNRTNCSFKQIQSDSPSSGCVVVHPYLTKR
jgi:hypothetical protein